MSAFELWLRIFLYLLGLITFLSFLAIPNLIKKGNKKLDRILEELRKMNKAEK